MTIVLTFSPICICDIVLFDHFAKCNYYYLISYEITLIYFSRHDFYLIEIGSTTFGCDLLLTSFGPIDISKFQLISGSLDSIQIDRFSDQSKFAISYGSYEVLSISGMYIKMTFRESYTMMNNCPDVEMSGLSEC